MLPIAPRKTDFLFVIRTTHVMYSLNLYFLYIESNVPHQSWCHVLNKALPRFTNDKLVLFLWQESPAPLLMLL